MRLACPRCRGKVTGYTDAVSPGHGVARAEAHWCARCRRNVAAVPMPSGPPLDADGRCPHGVGSEVHCSLCEAEHYDG